MRPLLGVFDRASRAETEMGGEEERAGVELYDCRMLSTSESVIEESRDKGQYSQIWESQRMRLDFAASRSASVTSLLNVALWSASSSSRPWDMESSS